MKVGFVGAGRVGSATAFSLLQTTDVTEIVFVDLADKLAKGEALDIKHAGFTLGKKVRTYGGTNFSKLKGCKLVIVTAGKRRTATQSRHVLAKENAKIVRSVCEKIRKRAPRCVVLMVTNPVDAMTLVAWKTLKFPRSRVVGSGGILDTARLHSLGFKGIVFGKHNDGVFGEHGDSMLVPADAKKKMKKVNADVIRLKGATQYAPALSIAVLAKAILRDEKKILPCSCVLDGEYGLKGVAIGVPARVGKRIKVVKRKLDIAALQRSASTVRKSL